MRTICPSCGWSLDWELIGEYTDKAMGNLSVPALR